MCIAIVNKSNLIGIDTFRTIYQNNPDGIGFAYSDGNNVRIHKSLNDVDGLYSIYSDKRNIHDGVFLIHSRIKTHGLTDLKNCHPFHINNHISLIHNGMIDSPILNPKKSDTLHFVELIRSLKNPENLFNPKSIESAWIDQISNGSKVCLLHSDGRYAIYGENLGHWDGDNWYSNNSYKSDYGSYNIGSWYDYDNWDSWRGKKSATNGNDLSAYQKRSVILEYFGYDPLSLSVDQRIKEVNQLCDEMEMDLNELHESITSEYQSIFKEWKYEETV